MANTPRFNFPRSGYFGMMPHTWDYLILTASNDRQAAGYESQLADRRRCGLLPQVGTALVVADPRASASAAAAARSIA